jgi:putative Ca2+/H+ antiporter (TMEM165/GDT1 family)
MSDWRSSGEIKIALTVFITVFLAEIGDKTQLATMLFASDKQVSRWTVFLASSAALVLAAGIGVLAGDALSRWVSPQTLKLVAGSGFVLIGFWVLWGALKA